VDSEAPVHVFNGIPFTFLLQKTLIKLVKCTKLLHPLTTSDPQSKSMSKTYFSEANTSSATQKIPSNFIGPEATQVYLQ
jgi:hypothetical protein